MSDLAPALGQIAVLLVALAVAVPVLGRYLARVYTAERHLAVERASYRALRVDPDADQHWKTYTMSVLGFSLVSVLVLYGLERLQSHLPLSIGAPAMDPAGAWNTAVSFVTNTNWQWYSGETAAGHLLQMAGFAVQNFLSAAVGIAVVVALIRGLARSAADGRVGNFWSDLVRTVVRILLPLSVVVAVVLIAMGVIQNLSAHTEIATLAGGTQHALGGPVASQEAIKEIGIPAMSGKITVVAGTKSVPFSPQRSLSKILTLVSDGQGNLVLHFDLPTLKELYGNAFDGVLLQRGDGTKTPVTPQDVASAMMPELRKTAAVKTAVITNVAK